MNKYILKIIMYSNFCLSCTSPQAELLDHMSIKQIRQGVEFAVRPHPRMFNAKLEIWQYIFELTPHTARTFELQLEKHCQQQATGGHQVMLQKKKIMNYYHFGMARDFKLLIGNDTLPCQIQLFEATGNLFNGIRQVLEFATHTKFGAACTLLYYDPIFSSDTLKFNFSNLNTSKIK